MKYVNLLSRVGNVEVYRGLLWYVYMNTFAKASFRERGERIYTSKFIFYMRSHGFQSPHWDFGGKIFYKSSSSLKLPVFEEHIMDSRALTWDYNCRHPLNFGLVA